MSQNKNKLLELEKTGQFVFHGSEFEIEEFEPRQAFNYINQEQIPDGDPAVFASNVADYAILMAIINKTNCPRGYNSSVEVSRKNGVLQIKYRASASTISQIKDEASGWVYVFDKKLFKPKNDGEVEYLSYTKVRPLEKIKVKKEDLPENIEVF